MANIIVVANQKGGVGKTTTVVHAALHFSQKGKVCVVDTDSQGNATSTIQDAGGEALEVTASALFGTEKLTIPEPKVALSVIPADGLLSDVESQEMEAILNPAKHLRGISWADFIIIDTPPSLGRRLLGSLIASHHVLAPIELNGYSADGLNDLLATIEMVKERFNPELNFLGVLVNKVHSTSKSQKQFFKHLVEILGDALIPQIIGSRVSVSDAIDTGRASWDMASKGGKTAGSEFKKAFFYVEKRMGLKEEEKGEVEHV